MKCRKEIGSNIFLFNSTGNAFPPGGSGTTIRQNTQKYTQGSNRTQHTNNNIMY
jgi:hypothetical protein